ncbi:MAG: twin-arginine translocation signal domain-containing protein [Planctomycetaceae bacterium]|nr:MAG: twin-arginine translocation signal domain-containing protein [Planctomycetaceae bacterium]
MSTPSTINRRDFLKTAGTLALAAAVLAPFAIGQEPRALPKPNIILIYADDLGWSDVGYQSEGLFLTPQIDQLGREGVVFSNGYAAAPNCGPSRASILSGGYTPRHGLFSQGRGGIWGPHNLMRLVQVKSQNHLDPSIVTVAEALKGAGYATGHFGKYQVATPPGSFPLEQGFDVAYHAFDEPQGNIKGEGVAGWESTRDRKGPPNDPSGVFTLTDKAVEFMASNRNRPFFVYLAHYAIHPGARNARPESRQLVAERAKGANVNDVYMANTYDFDESIGKLLAKLRELELEKNTLVVFTSDNGAHRPNGQPPLRGIKQSLYEGGIRVPFIVRWPGVAKAGATSAVPVTQVDLYPTFLAAAGAPVPAGTQLDGLSLLPVLEQPGSGLDRTSIFWHYPCYVPSVKNPAVRLRDPVFGVRPVSVIRKGDWKLLLYHEEWQLDGGRAALATNNAVELYNLKDDIGEHKNLALENTAKRDELLDDLLKWIADIKAPMPTEKNPAYDPNAKP